MTSWIVVHILSAYLIGSISSAIILTRILKRGEIRDQGSGNPGATNVLRVAGKKVAAIVFIFDVLKGALPVYSAYLLGYHSMILSLVAIAASLGHMFPIYFRFKGGKAVATAFGALLPLSWWLTLCLFITWVSIFAVSRISSLASIASLIIAPIFCFLFEPEYAIAVTCLCILIIIRHKTNITRLLTKKEARIDDVKTD